MYKEMQPVSGGVPEPKDLPRTITDENQIDFTTPYNGEKYRFVFLKDSQGTRTFHALKRNSEGTFDPLDGMHFNMLATTLRNSIIILDHGKEGGNVPRDSMEGDYSEFRKNAEALGLLNWEESLARKKEVEKNYAEHQRRLRTVAGYMVGAVINALGEDIPDAISHTPSLIDKATKVSSTYLSLALSNAEELHLNPQDPLNAVWGMTNGYVKDCIKNSPKEATPHSIPEIIPWLTDTEKLKKYIQSQK
ncbi:MAG: hypothetical protein V1744_05485 [Candidatus Altiarchaeota archaeon]